MSILKFLKIAEKKFVTSILTKRRNASWIKKIKGRLGEKTVLTPAQKKDINEFYKKYTKINMIFPEFYTQKTGKFFRNYMADNIYYCKVDPYFNNWEAAKYLDNKCYYDEWFFKGINTPKTIVKRINGLWSIKEENATRFISKEKAYELVAQNDCFIKQATLSVGGQGVRKILKGTSINEVEKIVNSLQSDIIVQEAIEQSNEMSRLNPTSVNTVRVLSFLDLEGNVKIYSTIVRMGINDSIVDNASSGGITCGIEQDGRLKSVAYAANGTRYESHPTSGLDFSDVVIPNYNTVLSITKELHKSLPHFRLLSWDFAIDKNDEPLLIEVNLCYGELDFHQLNNGPIFGDDTSKILDEVFQV